jgi:predicted DNA-binding protein with PD1-like motif
MRQRFVLPTFVIALFCATSAHGQSAGSYGRSGSSEPAQYGPAFRKLLKGQAPQMRVQVLNRSSQETTYAVIFGKGDEVLAGLAEFAKEKHIGAARITGIGAIRSATLGWLDPQRKMYRLIPIAGQSEVLSLLGDIALLHGEPVIHAHMVVGYPDGSVHGGHLIEAHVWPTLEVLVTEYPAAMRKKMDAESGMALIDPTVKTDR